MRLRIVTYVLAAVLAAVLVAGCGGGGTTQPDTDDPTPGPSGNTWGSLVWNEGQWGG